MNDSTISLILGALMGLLGGILTIPINGIFNYHLKRDEIYYRSKLDWIYKQRELLLQHQLEAKGKSENNTLIKLEARLSIIERQLGIEK
jgi:hypothetical protein